MSSLNHIFKFGTTVLAALVLSACGSSGGGDSNNNEATPTIIKDNKINPIHLLITMQQNLISKQVVEQVLHLRLLTVTVFLFAV